MKQSGSYSALQSFGYGLAIVATTLISFAATAANFLLIWIAPLAFAADSDDLMRIMIFWVFMIGPPIAFVLSLYLLIKYFFSATLFPEEDTKTKYMPYGIKDIFSLIASCLGIMAIYQTPRTPFSDWIRYNWAPPLFVIWGWVVIRSIRYTAWKLRTQEQTNQKTTIAKDDQNHSD